MMRWQTGIIIHGIGDPARAPDPGEAPYWISLAQFDILLDMIVAQSNPSDIRISFDDGNLSDHDIALPRLTTRGLRAEFFVLTGRIGQAGSLDINHILALQDAGMAIGSHGVNHVDWRALDHAGLLAELRGSRQVLEGICGRPVAHAGIPFGAYNGRVLSALHSEGFTRAYSSDRGRMTPEAFLCPRTSVHGGMGRAEFTDLLAGKLPIAQHLRRAIGMTLRRLPLSG